MRKECQKRISTWSKSCYSAKSQENNKGTERQREREREKEREILVIY